MKKSGSFAWFVLFGLLAESFYLFCAKYFFGQSVDSFSAAFSLVEASLVFLALRFIMDWELNDSPVEDYLRETYISERISSRFVFATIGGFVLFFSNPAISIIGFRSLAIGILATVFTQSFLEFCRVEFNKAKETQKKIFLRPLEKGVKANELG